MNRFYYSLPTHYKLTTNLLQTCYQDTTALQLYDHLPDLVLSHSYEQVLLQNSYRPLQTSTALQGIGCATQSLLMLSAQNTVNSTTHADASTANTWEYVVHPTQSQLASWLLRLVGLLQSSTLISQANSHHQQSCPPCAATWNMPLVLGCNSCLDTPSSSWIPIFYFLHWPWSLILLRVFLLGLPTHISVQDAVVPENKHEANDGCQHALLTAVLVTWHFPIFLCALTQACNVQYNVSICSQRADANALIHTIHIIIKDSHTHSIDFTHFHIYRLIVHH